MRSRVRIAVAAAVVGAVIAWLTVNALVLGSGILPVPLANLYAMPAAAGAVAGAVAGFILLRRWVLLPFVLAAIVAIAVANVSFHRVVDEALVQAERYGSRVATLIEQRAAQTGEWPAELKDVPGLATVPRPDSPFLSDAKGEKVAGFFLSYRGGSQPSLWVARRGYGAAYDFGSHSWAPMVDGNVTSSRRASTPARGAAAAGAGRP